MKDLFPNEEKKYIMKIIAYNMEKFVYALVVIFAILYKLCVREYKICR